MSAPVRTGVAAAAHCLALDQLAAEVLDALHAAAIPAVLLKGAGLAHRVYPDRPDERRYSDVDLLVAPVTFDRAQQVLAGLGLEDRLAGMRPDEMHWHERLWGQPGPGSLAVDLHRGFAGVGDPTAFWELISATAEPLALSGATARVPDAAGCALVVGLHAARPGRGRKALTDLVVALALLPDPIWEEAARRARLTRSTSAFARGLRRDPVGAALSARLGLPAESPRAGFSAARASGRALPDPAAPRARPGPQATVRYLVGRLVPSRACMRRAYPLARRGAAGLAFAYLWRLIRAVDRVCRRAVDLDGRDRLTRLWSVRALRRVRRQLADAPLAELDLSGPPAAGRGGSLTVQRVLARRGASCLETALVLQRWWAGQGVGRDLLIGVSAPGEGFRAHAWLHEPEGPDQPDDHAELTQIHRRATPAAWLASDRPARPRR